MSAAQATLVFGPVPSRRLGRSLGVSNIPPKVCSYSCAYCQVGRTTTYEVQRRYFFQPMDILAEAAGRLGVLGSEGEHVDYLSFVPDGEPTLDRQLGRTIELLQSLGLPVAVISNASLIDREEVRPDLRRADWVCLKLDTVHERIWRRLNRPHRSIELDAILEGLLRFRESFAGRLVTETMLVAGCNEQEEDLNGVASFLRRLRPDLAYLSIPTRPPAERWIHAPEEDAATSAYQVFVAAGQRVELLTGSEGDSFTVPAIPKRTCWPSPRYTRCCARR